MGLESMQDSASATWYALVQTWKDLGEKIRTVYFISTFFEDFLAKEDGAR